MDQAFWIWVVRAAGMLQLLTVALAHLTPIPAGWDQNLARLPEVHRRFAIAQNIFIGGVMVFAGIVSLVFAPNLITGSGAARIICGGIALWWGARLLVLPCLRVGPELRTAVLRIGFVLLHLECVGLAGLYGWLALAGP